MTCWLYLQEILKDAELDWRRCIELPFAPYVGMPSIRFHYDDIAPGYDFSDCHHVEYVLEDDVFWCWAKYMPIDGCPCKPKDKCCVAKPGHINWMKRGGWELEGQRRGKRRRHTFKGMFGARPSP